MHLLGHVDPVPVRPRGEAFLHELAHVPVLARDAVDELDGVLRVEVVPRHGGGLEQPLRHDACPRRPQRPQGAVLRVVGEEIEHQGGINQLTVVLPFLLVVEAGQERPPGRPAQRERAGALAEVGDVVRPGSVHDALAVKRHEIAQLGMHARAVIAFLIVLDQDLPVALDLVRGAPPDAQGRERIAPEAPRDRAQVLGERRGAVAFEIDEQETTPGLDRDWVERELLLAEPLALVEMGRADEPPVEGVRPRVVRAGHRPLEMPLVHIAQARPAMAADVVEGTRPPVPVAHHDHAFAPDRHGEEVARLLDPLLAPGAQPGAAEDPLPFALQDLRVAVRGAGQRRIEPHFSSGDRLGHRRSP